MITKSKKYVMVLEGESPRLEGTEQAAGDELREMPSRFSEHEVREPNPKGSSRTDTAGHKKLTRGFDECGKIGTWNVRSMYTGKLEIVKQEMTRTGINLLGISELCWTGKGHFQSEDHKIFYSGHETIRRSGVAIICSKEVSKSVLGYSPINDRLISIRIQCKPLNMTIIQAYAPTTAAEESVIEEFYRKLQETVESTPSGDILIVMGDLNAKVGKSLKSRSVGTHGLGIRNEAGERLVEFCDSNDLRITNTCFKQPNRRLYTWTSPDGMSRNQIDFIMIKVRWASSIKSSKTLPGADCGSDHQLLTAEMRLKLRKMKMLNVVKYDTTKIPVEYNVEIINRFQLLEENIEPEEMWMEMKEMILLTAEKHISTKKKTRKSPWLSEAALKIAEQRREEKKKGNEKREIQKLNSMFQKQARVDKENYLSKICEELEDENKRVRTRELFAKVKEITGKFSPRIGNVFNKTGKQLSEQTEVKQRWREYTENLYGRDPTITDILL